MALSALYAEWFGHRRHPIDSHGRRLPPVSSVDGQELYDFLYLNEYPAWLCNSIQANRSPQALENWIKGLHTGETQVNATTDWTWEQRRKLGQSHLLTLAQDILNAVEDSKATVSRSEYPDVRPLLRSLELDGYTYAGGRIHAPESDVLDVAEERGVLQDLYTRLNLGESKTAFHHLALSEEHYLAQRWDDTISNSRKFFECVLAQVAAAHSERLLKNKLESRIIERAVEVRDYLERAGILEPKEKEAVAKFYGLLSHTGGHPYMAASDQARLLRQLALTVSQFVLLRLQGSLSGD